MLTLFVGRTAQRCCACVLTPVALAALAAPAMAAEAGIYFGQRGPFVGQQRVSFTNFDGSDAHTLFDPGPDSNLMRSVAVDPTLDRVFWLHHTAGFFSLIRSANLDGSDQVILDDPDVGWVIQEGGQMTADPGRGRLYALDAFGRKVVGVNYDGTGFDIIVGSVELPLMAPKPDLGRGIMFFGVGRDLSRINLDGTGFETLAPGASASVLAVDALRQQLYYAVGGTGDIWRIDYNGTNATPIISGAAGVNGVTDLEIDALAGKLYWTADGQFIRSASLDGSGVTDVFTAATGWTLGGIDIVPVPEPAAWLLLAACVVCGVRGGMRRA